MRLGERRKNRVASHFVPERGECVHGRPLGQTSEQTVLAVITNPSVSPKSSPLYLSFVMDFFQTKERGIGSKGGGREKPQGGGGPQAGSWAGPGEGAAAAAAAGGRARAARAGGHGAPPETGRSRAQRGAAPGGHLLGPVEGTSHEQRNVGSALLDRTPPSLLRALVFRTFSICPFASASASASGRPERSGQQAKPICL